MLTPSKIYAVKTGHPHDFSALSPILGTAANTKLRFFWDLGGLTFDGLRAAGAGVCGDAVNETAGGSFHPLIR